MSQKPLALGWTLAILMVVMGGLVWDRNRGEEQVVGLAPGISRVEAADESSRSLPAGAGPALGSQLAPGMLEAPRARRSAATSPRAFGSIGGRVLLGGLPAVGVKVSLQTQTEEAHRKELALDQFRQQVIRDSSLTEQRKLSFLSILESSSESLQFHNEPGELHSNRVDLPGQPQQAQTGKDGRFLFETVEPGHYQVVIEYPLRNDFEVRRLSDKNTITRYAGLLAALDMRLGDLVLPEEEEFLRVRKVTPHNATVRVRCEKPGLQVLVTGQGQERAELVGATDERGELVFPWEESSAVQVALHSGNGRALGSTAGFIALAANETTTLQISVLPGALRVSLPSGTEPVEHEAVQYSLRRPEEAEHEARVETIFSGSPPKNSEHLKTGPGSIEFKSLRPGTYYVTARFMIQQADQRWLPTGSPLHGTASVVGGGNTECSVH